MSAEDISGKMHVHRCTSSRFGSIGGRRRNFCAETGSLEADSKRKVSSTNSLYHIMAGNLSAPISVDELKESEKYYPTCVYVSCKSALSLVILSLSSFVFF